MLLSSRCTSEAQALKVSSMLSIVKKNAVKTATEKAVEKGSKRSAQALGASEKTAAAMGKTAEALFGIVYMGHELVYAFEEPEQAIKIADAVKVIATPWDWVWKTTSGFIELSHEANSTEPPKSTENAPK